jgi:Cu(I)/Ag(I) efflux system membrane fusion protein
MKDIRIRILRAVCWLLTAGAMMASAGCGTRNSSADEGDAGDARIVHQGQTDYLVLGGNIPGLRWAPVRMVEIPGTLEASGLINYDPKRVASIVSRVQGRIEDVRMGLWDSVKKGDPIVQLYSPDYMTAEAEYLQAVATSRDEKSPVAPGLEGMTDALAVAAKQKLTLLGMSAEDLLTLKAPEPTIWMRAPIGGTVLDDKVVRGSAVNPGDVLFTLGVLDEVWLTADIYEEDAPRLAVGQKLEAKVAAFPGETFKGMISNISPDINPDTHALQVRSKIENPGAKLKPRMLASVTIYTKPGAALGVPQEALTFDTDGYYAFIKSDQGRIARRKVEVASSNDKGFVRVRLGMKAGETIAVSETIQLNALWHRALGEGN